MAWNSLCGSEMNCISRLFPKSSKLLNPNDRRRAYSLERDAPWIFEFSLSKQHNDIVLVWVTHVCCLANRIFLNNISHVWTCIAIVNRVWGLAYYILGYRQLSCRWVDPYEYRSFFVPHSSLSTLRYKKKPLSAPALLERHFANPHRASSAWTK